MKPINDMLDDLDKQHMKEHRRSVFTELKFKWFDPATGMGNFPGDLFKIDRIFENTNS
jgi:hypothetical protein